MTGSVILSGQNVVFMKADSGRGPSAARLINGDISTSSDEFNTRVRKPYTITKQREKWTEQEHQKFLEALKLYGRSWHHIKEHIGTKTTVQVRSHAQKFFVKVERGVTNSELNGETKDIEIPPPRPKRKPSHPYPRKAGTNFILQHRNSETLGNHSSTLKVDPVVAGDSFSSPGYSPSGYYTSKLPVFSTALHSNGVAPEGAVLPRGVLGSSESEDSTSVMPVSFVNPEMAPTVDQQTERIPSDNNNIQIGISNGSGGKSDELFSSQIQNLKKNPAFNPQNPVNLSPQDTEDPGNNNMKSCEGLFPHNIDKSFGHYGFWPGHTNDHHFTYPAAPWPYMPGPFMNHSAAFAAAVAAAALAMRRGSSTMNQIPSPEDINAAVFTAASACWWALHGLAQGSHTLPMAATSMQLQKQNTGDGTTLPNHQQVPQNNPCSVQKEVSVSPLFPQTPNNCEIPLLVSPKMSSSIPDTPEKRLCFSADDLDLREQKLKGGSSSGSNTPALLSNSSEQENPSLSENEKADLQVPADGRKRAFQAVGGDGCIKLKTKMSERGRPQQKESRNGESDNGKRLKGSHHELDLRKEVSSQGRKAFEALFSCGTLPQTFSRGPERSSLDSRQGKAVAQQALRDPREGCGAFAAEFMLQKLGSDRSSQYVKIIENDKLKGNGPELSSTADANGLRTCLPLENSRSSIRTSGFVPYHTFTATSRACAQPADTGLTTSH